MTPDCDHADEHRSTRLTRFGGELADRVLERRFRDEHVTESWRQARLVLLAAAVLNTLFLASDWRFYGEPHFWIAVPARLFVILTAIGCRLRLTQTTRFGSIVRLMAAWMVATATGVAILCTSRTDIALFVLVMLPAFYYLVVPSTFPITTTCGAGCSVLLLIAYGPTGESALGLILAQLMLNCALMLVVSRGNRLRRLEWLSARAERRTRDALEASRRSLETMFEASPVPLIVTARSTGEILKLNDKAREFLGTDGVARTTQGFYADPNARNRMLAMLDREGGLQDHEVDIRNSRGEARTVLAKVTIMELEGRECLMIGVIDITARKLAEERLEKLAATDSLTGLPNRTRFFAAGRAEMQRARRSSAPLSLLMLDIDDFKRVNDAFGHSEGDRVLRSFSLKCQTVLRKKDVVARLGGEEFAVLLPNTDLARAQTIAETLRQAIERIVEDEQLMPDAVTISIGVTSVRHDEADLEPALARADRALYAAKRAGRNQVMTAEEDLVPEGPTLIRAMPPR